MDHTAFQQDTQEFERVAASFAPPPYETLPSESSKLTKARLETPAFDHFVSVNVSEHKIAGYAIVTVSLKPINGIPGDATSHQMCILADACDRFGFGELRVSHEQNIILPHVKRMIFIRYGKR